MEIHDRTASARELNNACNLSQGEPRTVEKRGPQDRDGSGAPSPAWCQDRCQESQQKRLCGQSRARAPDQQGDEGGQEIRQGRSAIRARLATLSKQGSSPLEGQGRACLRVRMRLQRVSFIRPEDGY